MKRNVLFFLSIFVFSIQVNATSKWDNVSDYTYMWWKDGWRNSADVFNIQTSSYGLSFDYDDFQINNFGPLAERYSEQEALGQDNDVISELPAVSIECSVKSDDVKYKVVSADPDARNCMLIESGKFFQRRWFEVLNFETGAPAGKGYFQVAAWPDRISFILFFTPDSTLTDAGLEFTVDFDDQYSEFVEFASAKGFAKSSDDSGYVIMAESLGQISCDTTAKSCTVNYDIASWAEGVEKTAGVIVYPLRENCSGRVSEILLSELSPPSVSAEQLWPVSSQLTTSYDKNLGFRKIDLRNDNCPGRTNIDNDRIERVKFTITNNYDFAYPARLCFSKLGVCGITGISAILCDTDNEPLGIPVQLSKDWHNSSSGTRFDVQSWFRGMSIVTVPANSSVELVYTSVNGFWGQAPAASHAQLCLVGWGGNQLWDQASLGSWGESITYDPDINLGRSMVDDVRPMMVWNMNKDTPEKWWWTNNVGGCDFLTVFDSNGSKFYNSNMKSMYSAYCPNITDVTYAGTAANDNIKLSCRTRLLRTDDYIRAVYDLRYDVVGAVTVDANPSGNNNRIAFFQLGSDGYNNHNFEMMARGDENGLVEEWAPVKGGLSYSRTSIAGTGSVNWFSLHQANSKDTSAYGAWANRGLVVREYEGRLGGVVQSTPYFSVYGTNNGGVPSANVELSLPSGVTELKPGDYVEAQVVYVIVPQYAADYYGPNANLSAALLSYEDGWEMIHREATSNDIEVNVISGELVSRYPTVIKACGGAEFDLSGGLGFVPVTITNLPDYKGFTLQRKVDGSWTDVDQSVNGNDFWQCDYDGQSETFKLSFNVDLDTDGDERLVSQWRLTGVNLPVFENDINCDNSVDMGDLFVITDNWLERPSLQGVLSAHWSFDEGMGATAGDNSAFENDVDTTGVAWVEGYDDSCVYFDGTNAIGVPISIFDNISEQVTISLWQNGDVIDITNEHSIAFYATGTDLSRIFLVHLPWQNGAVHFVAGQDATGYDTLSKAANSTDYHGQWNHWTFSKNTTTGSMKIYLNGSLFHETLGNTRPIQGIESFTIGAYGVGGGGGL